MNRRAAVAGRKAAQVIDDIAWSASTVLTLGRNIGNCDRASGIYHRLIEAVVWRICRAGHQDGEELAKKDLYCAMQVTLTELPGVLVLKPQYFQDHRGYFVETYNARAAHQIGLKADFVQDNQAFSMRRGTVRALHFQVPPRAQAKLVRVLRGSIYDVAVDLRTGSPTYGRWTAATLTAQGGEQIFVPRGFGHGYCTLEDNTEVAYKVDCYYAPECEHGIAWNDPTLAIGWPIAAGEAVLSDKDQKLLCFREFVSPFRYPEG